MFKHALFAVGLALTAGTAEAAVTFDVNGTFNSSPIGVGSQVGTLTGTFTTTDDLSTVTIYNLSASPAGGFAGFRYTNSNSMITASVLPSQFFQIDSPQNVNELRLYFNGGLTANGGTFNPVFSYEAEPSGGIRFLSGSARVAAAGVPEPATWAMMMLGFGAIGMALRGRAIRTRVRFG